MLRPKPGSLADVLIDAVGAVYEKAAAKQITIDTDDFQDISLMPNPNAQDSISPGKFFEDQGSAVRSPLIKL